MTMAWQSQDRRARTAKLLLLLLSLLSDSPSRWTKNHTEHRLLRMKRPLLCKDRKHIYL